MLGSSFPRAFGEPHPRGEAPLDVTLHRASLPDGAGYPDGRSRFIRTVLAPRDGLCSFPAGVVVLVPHDLASLDRVALVGKLQGCGCGRRVLLWLRGGADRRGPSTGNVITMTSASDGARAKNHRRTAARTGARAPEGAAGAADAEQQAADFVERVRDRPGEHATGQRREAVGYYGDPTSTSRVCPTRSTSPGSTRPTRPDERPAASGFTDQKSSATSSVLVAPRHPRKD